MMKRLLTLLLIVTVAVGVLTSCARQKYSANPLSVSNISRDLINKDPRDAGFSAYLANNGFADNQLPLKSWGINELTLAALYFNPKLNLAKVQWAASMAAVTTADQRAQGSLDASIARGNQGGGEPKPWSYGLSLNLPLETANKRQLRREQAAQLAEATRIEIAQTAWQLRSQINVDLINIIESNSQAKLLKKELRVHNDMANMLEKRVKLGLQSNTELSQAKLLQLKTLKSLNTELNKMPELTAILAADVGLTTEKFSLIPLELPDAFDVINQQKNILSKPDAIKQLQATALLNRLDVRAALARYAAAESKIKLEIAKQTPDILFSPAFLFDFGNSIWSLGLSNLLFLLNDNKSLATEATKLRDIEAAQFEVLQAKIIADLARSEAQYNASVVEITQSRQLHTAETSQFQRLQKQFNAGNIDRIELTQSMLGSLFSAQAVHEANFKSIRAGLMVEDVMQHPLYDVPKLPPTLN